MKKVFRFSFIVALTFVLTASMMAQVPGHYLGLDPDKPYNRTIFTILEYADTSNNSSLETLLERNLDGFSFILENGGNGSADLNLKNPDGSFTPFVDAINLIKKHLDGDSSKIITLFLETGGNVDQISEIFTETGAIKYIFDYPINNEWPSIREMVASDKRLVVFSTNNIDQAPEWMLILPDYAMELPNQYLLEQNNIGTHELAQTNKSLSIFNGYSAIEEQWSGSVIVDNSRIPFFVEPFKRVWAKACALPNYIMIKNFDPFVGEFLMAIRNIEAIEGVITHNKTIIEDVHWKELNITTSGKFCFPLEPGEKLLLTPTSPGYKISPESIDVAKNSGTFVQFSAKPLDISENLELFLEFNNDAQYLVSSKKNKTVQDGVEYINDASRGKVALFGKNSFIALPKAEDLNLTSHDFTISVWIKIPKLIPEKTDYSIIGPYLFGPSNAGYSHNLHILVRNQKPYFGFFGNDITGNTTILPNQWYNIVCRYDQNNGEQAIFINGNPDSYAVNRPSYKGVDSLAIGIFGDVSSAFIGEMDNFSIWSRALSDKEIMGIGQEYLGIEPKTSFIKYLIIVPIILLAIFTGFIFRNVRKRSLRKKKMKVGVNRPIANPVSPKGRTKNVIRLFGDFQVIDKEGNDISSLFTAKVKQMFLIVLLNSQVDKTGISSESLRQLLWKKIPKKNADNVRRETMRKLRSLLTKIDTIEIERKNEMWFMLLSGPVYCDYLQCLALFENKMPHDEHFFNKLWAIIERGEAFKTESYEWLDKHKGYLCYNIVDILDGYLKKLSPSENGETIMKIADMILVNDPVNETAVSFKMKVMAYRNNHKMSKYYFDDFCSLYKEMYGEAYNLTYDQFLSRPDED